MCGRRLAGWQLEADVGHFNFVGFLRRRSLRVAFSHRCTTSSQAATTLTGFVGLTLLNIASWDAQRNRYVYQSDASEMCYGVNVAEWQVGRGVSRGTTSRARTLQVRASVGLASRLWQTRDIWTLTVSGVLNLRTTPSWETGRSTRTFQKCLRAVSSTVSGVGQTQNRGSTKKAS